MIRPDGYVKVLDFGIAKLIPTSAAAADSHTLTVHTVPGMLLGTVGYMAPEQIRGMPVDHRADIWSFAVLLHEMLAGRSPFAGPTSSDIIAAVLERNPPSLSSAGVTAPADLERIIGKALAKDREERYQSMKDLALDLRRTQKETLNGELPTKKGRRPLMLAAAGLVAAVLVAWGAWSWMQPKTPGDLPPPPGGSTTAAVPKSTFSYWLTVQTPRDGAAPAEVESTGNQVYSNKAKFLFNFSNPQPGFVYVLNEATGGSGEPVLTMLYPTPSIRAGSAEVRAGEVVSTGTFLFDPSTSEERVWIVWSATPQKQLEGAKRWVTQKDQGRIRDGVESAVILGLLMSNQKGTDARADEAARRTMVSGNRDLLVHLARLRTR